MYDLEHVRDRDISRKCTYRINRQKCLDYKIIKKIGEGAESPVYLVERKDGQYFAAKFIPASDAKSNDTECFPKSKSKAREIVKNELLLREIGVSVPIEEIRECEFVYQGQPSTMIIIVMKLYDMTLGQYKNLYPLKRSKDIQNMIDSLEEKIYLAGYSFSDTHEDNILVKLDQDHNIIDLVFIDLKLEPID